MGIDNLKRRIAAKIIIANALGQSKGYRFLCELSTDCLRLCNMKMEELIPTGATKEKYNSVIECFHKAIDAATAVAKSAKSSEQKGLATSMAADIIILSVELRSLANQVTILPEDKKQEADGTTTQNEVDAILDKVSRQGYGSLSAEELDKLKNFK